MSGDDPTPATTRIGRGLSIAIGLLSAIALASQDPAGFKWLIGLLFGMLFGIHLVELRRGNSVETLYPDPGSRLPMLTLELVATIAGIAVLMAP